MAEAPDPRADDEDLGEAGLGDAQSSDPLDDPDVLLDDADAGDADELIGLDDPELLEDDEAEEDDDLA